MPIALMLAAAATSLPPADVRMARMAALYDSVCLHTFPDDAAINAEMQRRGATPLTPAQVRVTLRDDPGRGWQLTGEDSYALVFIEMPPYHACSVRWPMPSVPDLAPYRRVADAYEQAHAGFAPSPPLEGDMGNIHVHMLADQRNQAGAARESLMVIDQHMTDGSSASLGEPVEMRFVRQIAEPGTAP